jgi:hypothetical protein
VAKEVLEPPRIHASVGQRVSGRMPDHVDVNRKRQAASPDRTIADCRATPLLR